jgi:oligopeptide/dipeptide ABC transporter ATP-binding protein
MLESRRAVMNPVLQVKDLVKYFPMKGTRDVVHAVTGVSFSIDQGETLGLVGESGSGKTTVGRCILRLTEPTDGAVLFHGKDITRMPRSEFRQYRPKMQMVFQDPYDSLNPRQTAAATIEEPLTLWCGNLDKAGRRRRVEELAGTVKMRYEMIDQYPHQMSGGEQQRVGIAKAIATSPDLLILDEPTSSLDPSAHAEIVDLLISLQKDHGYSYLFISHDLMTVRHISHRVAIMYLSQLIEIGTRDQIFEEPQHPYSRSLLSAVLYPDPHIKRSKAYVLRGEIPSPIHLPKGCFLASRCPVAEPRCEESIPPLRDIGDGHEVACFRVAKRDDLGQYSYGKELSLKVDGL